jgi:hypothetical protein
VPERKSLAGTLLLAGCLFAAGCSSVDLGNIDDNPDAREIKPGPGILDGEDGEPALTWKLGNSGDSTAVPSAAAVPPEGPELDEKAEFEQFKIWNDLRSNHPDSPEYREFRQWLEYREFKESE